MIFVPLIKELFGFPPREEPEFGGILHAGMDFEANKAGSIFHEMGAIQKGVSHLGFHAIDDGKSADNGDHLNLAMGFIVNEAAFISW
jgi:hypothetical protein